jgi:hypothetical protein
LQERKSKLLFLSRIPSANQVTQAWENSTLQADQFSMHVLRPCF